MICAFCYQWNFVHDAVLKKIIRRGECFNVLLQVCETAFSLSLGLSAAKATTALTKCRENRGSEWDVAVARLQNVLNARVGISIQSNLL